MLVKGATGRWDFPDPLIALGLHTVTRQARSGTLWRPRISMIFYFHFIAIGYVPLFYYNMFNEMFLKCFVLSYYCFYCIISWQINEDWFGDLLRGSTVQQYVMGNYRIYTNSYILFFYIGIRIWQTNHKIESLAHLTTNNSKHHSIRHQV